MAKAKPVAVGSYIFAGGFTLGMRQHFDVRAHLEETPYGVATARLNLPDLPIYVGPARWPLAALEGVDVVYGNPPCAAWSPLGRVVQAGSNEAQWANDPRVDCTRIHFGLLERLRPQAWVWESVPAAYRRGRPLVAELARRATALGYGVDLVLHDAQYLGARQMRRRFFFVATRVAIDWECPWTVAPTSVESLRAYPGSGHDQRLKTRSVPDAFWSAMKPGENGRAAYTRLVDDRRFAGQRLTKMPFAIRRARLDRPFGAVTGADLVHPTRGRFLTTGELLFISGFPLDLKFSVTNADAQASLIARGVLPPVGDWLGGQLARALRRGAPTSGTVREVNLFSAPGSVSPINL